MNKDVDPLRRRFLGSLGMLVAGTALTACAAPLSPYINTGRRGLEQTTNNVKKEVSEQATLKRIQEVFPHLDQELIEFRNKQFKQAIEDIQTRVDLPFTVYTDQFPGIPVLNHHYQELIVNPEVESIFDQDPTYKQVHFAVLATLPDIRNIPERKRDPSWVSNMTIFYINQVNNANHGPITSKLENGEPVPTGQDLIDFNASQSPTRNFIANLVLASGYYEGDPGVDITVDTTQQHADVSDFGGLLLQQIQGREDLVYRKPETGQVHTNTTAIDGILPNLHDYVQKTVLPRIRVTSTP